MMLSLLPEEDSYLLYRRAPEGDMPGCGQPVRDVSSENGSSSKTSIYLVGWSR